MTTVTMRSFVHRHSCDFPYLKSLLIIIIVVLICILVWLARGENNSKATFNFFDDNILETSFQDQLCQHLPIDVVYTWINGSDPIFIENFQKYTNTSNLKTVKSRFHNKNELIYSLRSLEMHAPWIRHVYIVTNGQIPDWLNLDHPKLTLVTHEDIFPDKADLPTFSSGAIEVHLHRIPGLSDKFLYFNDDVFLGKKVWPKDFITHDKGYKAYLAYNISGCSISCDWTKLSNGICDFACNTEMCGFDGGDCRVDDTADISTDMKISRKIRPKTPLTMGWVNMDMYGKSLIHVNRLYSQLYGYKRREAPPHMPHLLDKSIINNMQKKFETEFKKTSSHRTRNSEDMQLSFSYFHYMINEKSGVTINEIFDQFDTDKSGTWSTNEIRTILTRMYTLPLISESITAFERSIIDCFNKKKRPSIMDSPLDYINSTALVVSHELIRDCQPIVEQLVDKFGNRSRYRHEIVKSGENYYFLMLKSSLSTMPKLMDEIRSNPKKFVCVNDDLDPNMASTNEILLALLDDFYLSLFPLRSSFELPTGKKNHFAYLNDLLEWRASQARRKNILIIIVVAIFFIRMYHVFYYEMRRSVFSFFIHSHEADLCDS